MDWTIAGIIVLFALMFEAYQNSKGPMSFDEARKVNRAFTLTIGGLLWGCMFLGVAAAIIGSI